MPPYHPVLGHLPVLFETMSKVPSDAYEHYNPGVLQRVYPELGLKSYLDTWPIGPSTLFISHPFSLHQITQEYSLP